MKIKIKLNREEKKKLKKLRQKPVVKGIENVCSWGIDKATDLYHWAEKQVCKSTKG